MNWYIKIAIVYVARVLLRILHVFPIKNNRIIFSSYEGLSYTCNPKYIFEDIYEKDGNKWDYIWCLNNYEQIPDQYREFTKTVKFLSIRHIYYLTTSKVIISNVGIEPVIPKRENQIFINTWHGGGAYKRVQYNSAIFSKAQSIYGKFMQKIRKKGTDYVISSCQAFTKEMSKSFNIDEHCFIPIGLPRNDFLIKNDIKFNECLRNKIAEQYGLDTGKLWVLYAPTFRGAYRKQENIDNQICNERVVTSLKNRFGKEILLLVRAHINPEGNAELNNKNIKDVTLYPDMQELLASIDILITDYSSSIWDFSLTKRPGFLFTPDLDEYNGTMGFYTPIEQWPFPYAQNIDEFCNLIESYDPTTALEKIKNHHILLGSFEAGTACEDLYKTIISKV